MLVPLVLAFQTSHPHSDAQLVSSVSVAAPGKPFLAAIHMKMDPTWHTYWINPGDSGTPVTVDWTLPPGWKASPILWPTPHRIEIGGLVNYGYENQALFLVKLTPPPTAKTAQIKGQLTWLICQKGCLPAKQAIDLTLPIGTEKANPNWANAIQAAAIQLPATSTANHFAATRSGKTIQLTIRGPHPANVKNLYFFPANETIEPAAKQILSVKGDNLVVTLKVSDFAPANISRLKGLLSAGEGQKWEHNTDTIVVDTPVETNGR
ncbi:MAG TPA: protein-disulfide reductase DsbD domain-containing protein [Fimbriimonadaceae bacterium]|jgi:thiol:disulfide interchange protein DsbD